MRFGTASSTKSGDSADDRPDGRFRAALSSVQAKIGLVLFAAVLIASGVLTLRGTQATAEARTEGAETALTIEAERDATLVEKAVSGAAADLRALRETPPIQGYFRARASRSGIDPFDEASTESTWQGRLATIMAGYLEVRPS